VEADTQRQARYANIRLDRLRTATTTPALQSGLVRIDHVTTFAYYK